MVIDEIVLAIEPALKKIEFILLWKNKLKTVLIFTFIHFMFWLFFMYEIRSYCIISSIFLLLHLLDAYRTKKRKLILKIKSQTNTRLLNESQEITFENENLSSLGRYMIWVYNKSNSIIDQIRDLKQRNRLQYFLLMLAFWSIVLVISVKVKGSHLVYILFWIIFFLPAIIHYELAKKFLFKLLPLLQQLDHSMQYERRSILDKSELLVDVKLPKTEYDEDYEEENEFIRHLTDKEKRVIENLESEEEEDDEEDDQYIDNEDVNIEEIEEKKFDHDNLENVQRIRTIEYRVKISPNNYINRVEELDDSMMPNESLPNLDSSQLEDSDADNYNFQDRVKKRRAKNRPSLKEYYGDDIDFASRIQPRVDTNFDRDTDLGTVRMRPKKSNQHDQDTIDETFDFLDEEY